VKKLNDDDYGGRCGDDDIGRGGERVCERRGSSA